MKQLKKIGFNRPNARAHDQFEDTVSSGGYPQPDYSTYRGRNSVPGSEKMRKFPNGDDAPLCDNVGGRFKNGGEIFPGYSVPGINQFRPEVIRDDLNTRRPRNTFVIKKPVKRSGSPNTTKDFPDAIDN